MSAFPSSHFGSTLDTFFRPLVQQIHDCWAELKADSKKKPVDQAVWTQAFLGEEENEGLWYTSLRNTLTVSVHGETPQTSRPTTPQWRVGMSTKIETPKHHETMKREISWNPFDGSQPLRSGCAHALAEQGLRSRSSMQIKGPIAICVAQKCEAKIIAIQQFLANACNSTRKGLQYAETPFPGKQLSAFRGLDGTCILVHFHLVRHMKICVKMSLTQIKSCRLPVCLSLPVRYLSSLCKAVWTYRSLININYN